MLKWTERYNCHSLHLGHGMTLNVDWDGSKLLDSSDRVSNWKVSVLGEPVAYADSLAEGKALAQRWFVARVKRAVKAIETME